MKAGSVHLNKIYKALFSIGISAYVVWGLCFILRTSAIGLDGVRRWVLFDDGMISMRYALNIVNGNGAVWNAGEYVEGFTNPLWTALMSVVILAFGKMYAPLVIQLTGFALVMAVAVFAKKVASELLGKDLLLSVLATLVILAYYPLSYWSLSGMEVSALALCTAYVLYIVICKPDGKYSPIIVFSIFSLAYLIRPDGFLTLLPAVLILAVNRRVVGSNGFFYGKIAVGAAIFGLTIAVLMYFRLKYYGEIVPNTYTLKVTGYDLTLRIKNGIAFISPFLISTCVLWVLCLIGMVRKPDQKMMIYALLLAMPLTAVSYQVYVGGDPWLYWRQLSPSILPLVLMGFVGLKRIGDQVARKRTYVGTAGAMILAVSLNWQFRDELFKGKPYAFQPLDNLVKMSDLLNEVLEHGSVLVFWAGVLPYYYDGYAIDALGKSDKRLASMKPDLEVVWSGMLGVPGHAKHSLQYSLVEKSPDFIQHFKWFGDDYSNFVGQKYVAVKYKNKIACLKKGSSKVRWELVEVLGKCTDYEKEMF